MTALLSRLFFGFALVFLVLWGMENEHDELMDELAQPIESTETPSDELPPDQGLSNFDHFTSWLASIAPSSDLVPAMMTQMGFDSGSWRELRRIQEGQKQTKIIESEFRISKGRMSRKQAIVNRLLQAQIDLDESARCFAKEDESISDMQREHFRSRYAARDDHERYCMRLAEEIATLAQVRPEWKHRAESIRAQLAVALAKRGASANLGMRNMDEFKHALPMIIP